MGSKKKNRSKKTLEADWSKIEPDLLEVVAKRVQIEDLVRMKSIRRQWRSVIEERAFFINKTQLPWLFFPGSNTRICSFYSLTDNKYSRFLLPKHAVEHMEYPYICGLSYGWLFISCKDVIHLPLFLLNPLTSKHITLPQINVGLFFNYSNPRLYTIHKFILSENPSSSMNGNNDWMAVAIYGPSRWLAFIHSSALEWTSIGLEASTFTTNSSRASYDDMVIWKEKLYVIGHGTVNLRVCDMKIMNKYAHTRSRETSDPPLPELKIFELELPQDYPHPYLTRNYLVVSLSGDDLLLVCREVKNLDYKDNLFYYRTSSFFVYKLEIEGTDWKWNKLERISGNGIIFLGNNQSICLPASAECAASCIYYTDDLRERHTEGRVGGHDVGIFNIVTRQFRYLPGCPRSARLIWPPPLWFMPSLF